MLVVGAGILVGYVSLPEKWLAVTEQLSMGFLYLLLVGIGINLVNDSESLLLLRRLPPRSLLIVPLSAIGSICGAGLTMMLFGDSFWVGAAIGAGFGWYSLASVLLSGSLGALIASLAFLCNILRELLALMLIPHATKRFGIAGIVLGGATTMDTTLAVISSLGRRQLVFLGLIHGLCLSAAVPILVPLLAQLALRR